LTARSYDASANLPPNILAAPIPAGGTGCWLPLAEPLVEADPVQARSQSHSKDVTARKRFVIDPESVVMWVAVLRTVANGWLGWPIHAVTTHRPANNPSDKLHVSG